MHRTPLLLALVVLFLAAPCAVPVSATLALADSMVSGQSPGANTTALVPGTTIDTSATIMVIPSGATTFQEGHTLQLMTGLLAARWNVQVFVDSVPAAKVPQNGDVVFINGYLLSYPSGKDVTVKADVTGTVPQADTATTIGLIQATELDNSGKPVPGSSVTVERQIVPPVTTPTGGQGSVPGTAMAAPTKSPGFGVVLGLAGLCGGLALFLASQGRKV